MRRGGPNGAGEAPGGCLLTTLGLRVPVSFDLAATSGLRSGMASISARDGARACVDYEARKLSRTLNLPETPGFSGLASWSPKRASAERVVFNEQTVAVCVRRLLLVLFLANTFYVAVLTDRTAKTPSVDNMLLCGMRPVSTGSKSVNIGSSVRFITRTMFVTWRSRWQILVGGSRLAPFQRQLTFMRWAHRAIVPVRRTRRRRRVASNNTMPNQTGVIVGVSFLVAHAGHGTGPEVPKPLVLRCASLQAQVAAAARTAGFLTAVSASGVIVHLTSSSVQSPCPSGTTLFAPWRRTFRH